MNELDRYMLMQGATDSAAAQTARGGMQGGMPGSAPQTTGNIPAFPMGSNPQGAMFAPQEPTFDMQEAPQQGLMMASSQNMASRPAPADAQVQNSKLKMMLLQVLQAVLGSQQQAQMPQAGLAMGAGAPMPDQGMGQVQPQFDPNQGY